jgi:hypothetical protein
MTVTRIPIVRMKSMCSVRFHAAWARPVCFFFLISQASFRILSIFTYHFVKRNN